MEAVQVVWDPAVIDLGELLDIFYATTAPGLVDWESPGGFDQVRSGIFLADRHMAAAREHQRGVVLPEDAGGRVKTQIVSMVGFEAAGEMDRNFYKKNPTDGFCRSIIDPKLQKLLRLFPNQTTT